MKWQSVIFTAALDRRNLQDAFAGTVTRTEEIIWQNPGLPELDVLLIAVAKHWQRYFYYVNYKVQHTNLKSREA